MRKRTLVALAGGILAFSLLGPTRETGCMKYEGYHNDSDGNQKVFFDGGAYGSGIGFTPDELSSGREYRLKLKRYFSGLGGEQIIRAEECQREDTRNTD